MVPDTQRSQPHYEPKAYPGLEICILSGQIPQEDVPGLMVANPDFLSWYSARRKITPSIAA